MKLALAIAAALPIALLALSATEPVNAATPLAQEAGDAVTVPYTAPCVKKVVSNPCTSCHETGVMDIECKGNGHDYRGCATAVPHTCSNGARCDQESGVNPC